MAWALVAVAAIGKLVEGRAESNMERSAAKADKYQAQIAEMNAQAVGAQTSQRIEQSLRESRSALGSQRAAIAQSGTGFSGSNADIMRQSATNAQLDALNIQYEGEVQRRGLLNEAQAHRYNAKIHANKGKAAMRSRWLSAFGAGMQAYGNSGMGGG